MKTKKNFILLLVFTACIGTIEGQIKEAIHNFGNIQMHNEAYVGFHMNLINDGSFDNNLGLVGFYQKEHGLLISGAFSPVFHDFEMAVENDLHIDVPITINNSLNFIYGNIQADRNDKNVYVKLEEEAIYDGVKNRSKIDGYVAIEGQKEFDFPVGYDNIVRPFRLKFVDGVFFAKCEYYRENVGYPESLAMGFNTNKKDITLEKIYDAEFWHLNTSGLVQVSLSWNTECNLSNLVDDKNSISVAGWNIKEQRWDNLGNSLYEGNLKEGFVTSNTLNANDYEVFTLGFLFDLSVHEPGNYVLSPNGDGRNDRLELSITNQSPQNNIQIFNRSGQLVFEKSNYSDEFVGLANQGIIYRKGEKLPEGVYYYLISLEDLGIKRNGFFYIKH